MTQQSMPGGQTSNQTIDELASSLTGPIASALMTVAVFCLTAMGVVEKPNENFIDEIFAFIGGISLISAAKVIDSSLDKLNSGWKDRLNFIGHGYFLFSVSIGCMLSAMMILLMLRSKLDISLLAYGHVGITGILTFAVLMTQDNRHRSLWALAISSISFILLRIFHL